MEFHSSYGIPQQLWNSTAVMEFHSGLNGAPV
jgi:hypothetical protein